MNKTGQEVEHLQLIDEYYIICNTPVKTSTRTVTFKYVALVKGGVCVAISLPFAGTSLNFISSQVTRRPVETLADAKLYAGQSFLFQESE